MRFNSEYKWLKNEINFLFKIEVAETRSCDVQNIYCVFDCLCLFYII